MGHGRWPRSSAHKQSTGVLCQWLPWRLNLLRLAMRHAASSSRRHLRGRTVRLRVEQTHRRCLAIAQSQARSLASRTSTEKGTKGKGMVGGEGRSLRA